MTTVFNTFQGLTVQCARCHDHKFDPIPQDEYYRLQAVFAGVGRGDVRVRARPRCREEAEGTAGDARGASTKKRRGDRTRGSTRRSCRRRSRRGRRGTPAPASRGTVPEFTQDRVGRRRDARRSRPDGSIRSEGTRPEKDTYTAHGAREVEARHRGAARTAHRRHAAAHGPGPAGQRQPAPERVHVCDRVATASAVKPKPLAIRNATSDFDQAGWTVAHAIDGNTATAWGIYPQVGKPHEAVFELERAGRRRRNGTHLRAGTTARRRAPDRPVPAVA